MCWYEKGRVLPWTPWCRWSRPQHEGTAAVGLQAATVDSLPYFLQAPFPYSLYDQLQNHSFP